jgi:hypothetical protein
MTVKSFEIHFSDLTDDAQKRFLEFMGMKDPTEGNYDMDIVPLASIDIDEDLPEQDLQDSTDEKGGSEVEILLDNAEYKRDHGENDE